MALKTSRRIDIRIKEVLSARTGGDLSRICRFFLLVNWNFPFADRFEPTGPANPFLSIDRAKCGKSATPQCASINSSPVWKLRSGSDSVAIVSRTI